MVLLALEIFTRRVFYSHNLKIRLMLAFSSLIFVFFSLSSFSHIFFPRVFFLACEEKSDMRGKKKPMTSGTGGISKTD